MTAYDFGKRWTLHKYKRGNGSKQFGAAIWWNGNRAALEVNFYLWDFHIMRERSD